MSARLAAAFTTCQMAFGVIPSPQILSSRLTRRKIAPPLIPAAVIHSSTARFAQSGTGTVRTERKTRLDQRFARARLALRVYSMGV
jgi:hypothetical protein